jgi:hypothetical protein
MVNGGWQEHMKKQALKSGAGAEKDRIGMVRDLPFITTF